MSPLLLPLSYTPRKLTSCLRVDRGGTSCCPYGAGIPASHGERDVVRQTIPCWLEYELVVLCDCRTLSLFLDDVDSVFGFKTNSINFDNSACDAEVIVEVFPRMIHWNH